MWMLSDILVSMPRRVARKGIRTYGVFDAASHRSRLECDSMP